MAARPAIAIAIFVLTYTAIASGRADRAVAGMAGAVAMGALVLGGDGVLRYQGFETLLFLAGMLVVVGVLERAGFFTWLGLSTARAVRLDPLKVYLALPLLAGLLSAFVDSITVMLFMSGLTLEIASALGVSPLPLIVAEVTAANIGGSGTMVGDPPNVILGTHFGLSFADFAANTGPLALLGLLLNTAFFALVARKEIRAARARFRTRPLELERALSRLDPGRALKDRQLLLAGLVSLAYVVTMLLAHTWTGLGVGVIGISGAVLALLLGGPRKKTPAVLHSLDWPTLVFFASLFVLVGGLEEVGALKAVAAALGNTTGGRLPLALASLFWAGAATSALVDNVPFAASVAPVLGHLARAGLPLRPLVWAAALGIDIGGNGTPIGASANVVALAVFERYLGRPLAWREYLRLALPATAAVLLTLNLVLLLTHGGG